MDLAQKVSLLESELGLMKNELKPILIDLRDFLMRQDNPFGRAGDGDDDAVVKAHEEQDRRFAEKMTALRQQIEELKSLQQETPSVPAPTAPEAGPQAEQTELPATA